MRQITINAICGGVIGAILPMLDTPLFWIGIAAVVILIINSMIPERR